MNRYTTVVNHDDYPTAPICFNDEEGDCSGEILWTHGPDGTDAWRCEYHASIYTPEIDDDPICICGVHRSEHQLCGCPDGFITPEDWEAEKAHIATQARWDSDEAFNLYGDQEDDPDDDEDDLICNKAGSTKSPCAGDVQFWYRPSDGKMFPKCERHAEEANETYRHAQELLSPTPARWFNPLDAGERWSEDDE